MGLAFGKRAWVWQNEAMDMGPRALTRDTAFDYGEGILYRQYNIYGGSNGHCWDAQSPTGLDQ